jgi:hypothetical protein
MRPTIFRLPQVLALSVAMSGCEKKIERTNALRELCPGDLSGLSAKARQGGRDYAFAWMKAFEVMGTSGLHEFEELAFKETLPHIEPLKNGTPAEKTAFKAGLKIHEALQYLGQRLKSKKPLDNAELNALLRYTTGSPVDRKALADGVKELIFDYIQMVDESVFTQFWETHQSKSLPGEKH